METEVEGIVLKETLYSETSKIVQIVTKEYGLVSVMAKGASSYKSNLRSLTLPFLYGKFLINYKKDKLSTLKGGKIIKLYGLDSKNIEIYAYLSFICELTYKVLLENNDNSIFSILKNSMDKISEGLNPKTIKNIVEFKYLDYLGISPNLQMCQKCMREDEFRGLDGKIGGFICRNCYTNERIVSPNFDRILRRYQEVDIEQINEIKLSDENAAIVDEFLNDYYQTFSAIHLNSESLLSIIDK